MNRWAFIGGKLVEGENVCQKCAYLVLISVKNVQTMAKKPSKMCYKTSRKGGYVIKRIVEEDILAWKGRADRKPLVLMGSRQVRRELRVATAGWASGGRGSLLRGASVATSTI